MAILVANFATRNTQLATTSKLYKLSTKAVSDVLRRAQRGGRVREIREAMGLQQDAFGAELTKAGAAFGLEESYNKDKVSKIETGARDVTVDEMALLLAMDPKKRTIDWLVFGAASTTTEQTPSAPAPKRLVTGTEAKKRLKEHQAEQPNEAPETPRRRRSR